jgi:hypothetical protein
MKILLSGRHPFFRKSLRLADYDEPELQIDARELSFVSPLELAGIAALVHAAAADHRNASLVLPETPGVTSYLQRMDLLRYLDGVASIEGELPADDRTDQSDVLQELTQLRGPNEADELAARIVPLARKHASIDVTNAVFMGMGEFLDNACTHASSEIGVFAAAQAYSGETSGRRGLELAVVDGGIGILGHLSRNPRYARFRQSVTAIRYALTPGVTGTTDHRGYGFSDVLREVARAGKGRLVVRSGDGIGRVTVQGVRETRDFARCPVTIPGTWVWLRVRIP